MPEHGRPAPPVETFRDEPQVARPDVSLGNATLNGTFEELTDQPILVTSAWMHIEKILLRDVGPFEDVTIEFPKGTDPRLADVYLLTGPNGTGKSTILYALASIIRGKARGARMEDVDLGSDLLAARMRSNSSVVALRTDEGQTFAVSLHGRRGSDSLPDPFGGAELHFDLPGTLDRWESGDNPLGYALYVPGSEVRPSSHNLRCGWATFAYAGARSVSDVEITAVSEPKQSPFDNSLSFFETADTDRLANWIASQNFRRLKAKEAGHVERAEQLAQSVRDIEKAIGDIIDDPGFGFSITDDDDDVRIRWKGTIMRLGHLPDGLKSIVSWVADLLMRLDRIPWQDDTPVLQRQFLLLLDEVDIHLHPAWQRKVLPLAQRMFPNAQIIASTHSPFVVASVDDSRIITLGFQGQSSVVANVASPQLGVSYSAVLRSIFGIDSEFDIDTERHLGLFHDAKRRLLTGDPAARADVDRFATLLSQRSEELREIVALELGQMQRQLVRRSGP